jgi:hypothetical protein
MGKQNMHLFVTFDKIYFLWNQSSESIIFREPIK